MSFFGTNIKKIRQVKGLSQKAFADLFDLNRGVISAYEEGRAEPKIDTLLKVARYFNLDLDDFLTKPLQVNNLVSGSVIDRLMFSPTKHPGDFKAQTSSDVDSGNFEFMQKILAEVDVIYECKDDSVLAGYQKGDFLFLVRSEMLYDGVDTLVVIEQGTLKYLSAIPGKDKNAKDIFKIAGYFSGKQKNVISEILARLDLLEQKSLSNKKE
ncbi:helix-turn-helix transcriptional regulator [Chryseobacterium wangxinyae]|uniref:helix-turn-helix domain-containing protein n=1 Tax=Chryseobacterium sp. CY350 TaxID=2997336 RepID=UPI00226EBD6A|nr:helix-turn-helix transcriptional regulator [Chryseobacterium sp. CY350]MCY0976790.1 helix-turn-helix transcriptional regulator [Chryseobacterium sp. CY350]WBZ96791.1 helix-turn-helix transcriptional regulator [Chryseobacterium sp. CY350]